MPSSPTRLGTSSSSGINNASEQKSIALKEDNSSKLAISKESTNLADGIKETTSSHLGPGLNPVISGVSCQNNKQMGHSAQGSIGNNASAMRNSKEVKHRDNKLKDAIEAALLKKPGIYRKNKVSDQSDESSVATINNEVAAVDRLPHSRNAGNLTSVEVSTDCQGQIIRNFNVDHSKQSNGSSLKQSMILSAEGKHLTTAVSSHDDAALPSLSKIKAIPDHECIWQYGFFLYPILLFFLFGSEMVFCVCVCVLNVCFIRTEEVLRSIEVVKQLNFGTGYKLICQCVHHLESMKL